MWSKATPLDLSRVSRREKLTRFARVTAIEDVMSVIFINCNRNVVRYILTEGNTEDIYLPGAILLVSCMCVKKKSDGMHA